ncbi:MAG: pyridoxal phosphate-dependent aminotransferase [Chromatiales bacterium]|nr:pyridoxal phosphate-dependent aminotransferase [Chromatiales bacterium]
MSLAVSQRVQRVKPSPTMAVTALAAELRARGRDVIDLGAGEPDFDTPEHIKEAGIKAIRDGRTKYTQVEGTPDLKAAIIEKFRRDNNLEYSASEVMVSSGAKQCCYNLCIAVLNAGDEAIVPAPYWVSYPDMVKLAEAEPVIVSASMEDGFKVTPRGLEAAITPSTRLVFLNSPSNPSGAAYTRSELAALGEVLLEHPGIIIAADDMYEHIYWAEEPFASFADACPAMRDRTVTINGVSKAYAMTGWRIGYAAGPQSLIGAMKKIQSQSTSNPCSISQAASVAALNGSQDCVREMNQAFRERHDYVVEALNGLPGVSCLPSAGTFYAFPDVSEAIRQTGYKDDIAFAEALLQQGDVAVVPGSAFGAPGHMRLSYACGIDTLKEAIARMSKVLGKA